MAVLSLAIGTGANSAVFSMVDALLLRPLPVARPSEVLTVTNNPIVNGQPATATIQLVFSKPLPDDRFTLTIDWMV